jgi:predicted small metal-binding protein
MRAPGVVRITWSVERTAGGAMGKMVECSQVDPSSGCKQVIRGKDEAEVMRKTAEHAKEHGLRDVTPELQAKVRAAIHDE